MVGAGSIAATSGCLNRFRRTAEREEPSQVSLEIATLPDDEDPHVIRIANHVAEALRAAGIDIDVIPRQKEIFLRQVLINQDFDLYVWRTPPQSDPDFLRPLLHSRFAEEPGWQNPFGFSNSLIDEMLMDQMVQTGESWATTVRQLQDAITEERPFVPIAFDTDHRLSRTDRVIVDQDVPPGGGAWILALRRSEELPDADDVDCRLGTTDGRLTHNLNPIAVEYRGETGVVDAIYDPVVREWGNSYVPWGAESWEWTSPIGASAPTIEITLREDILWHDEEPLTADDVAFTYEFLADTTMTEEDPNVPAPRFRGRTSLIDSTEATDDRIVRVQFERSSRRVASQALTLPILPEHIWSEHTELTDVAGITIADATTDALVIDNTDPVGSGAFRVTNVSGDDGVELARFEDHFVWSEGFRESLPPRLEIGDFNALDVDARPSAANVAESIREGGLDTSLTGLGREHAVGDDDTNVNVSETTALYHVGFNVREGPLTGHGFRNAIARLIDHTYVVDEIFQGGAIPTLSPIADTDLVPSTLQWTGPESATFAGEPGTGEVEADVAMSGFRDAGFQYSADGELLSR